jgi:superfamily II DNA or RNA helicase
VARKNIQVERLDKLTPRDYQHEAIVRMRAEMDLEKGGSGSVLLADDLGLGKTAMIVETIRKIKPQKSGLRILWIGPPVTHLQVKKTLLRQFPGLPDDKVRLVGPHGDSGTKYDAETWRRMKKKESGIFLVGPEHMAGKLGYEVTESGEKRKWAPTQVNIRKAMRDGRVPPWQLTGTWDLVVFDEVHRARNRKDALIGKTLRIIKALRKIGASATPGGNLEEDIWFVLNWLWVKRYPSFWDWAKKHFTIEVDEYGWDPVNQCAKTRDVVGKVIDPVAMWEEIPCAIRRLSKDILNLPDVIEHEIEVSMTLEQREMYDDFEIQCFTWMDDVPVGTPLPIVKQIRLRQLALGQTTASEGVMSLSEAARRQKVTVESLQDRIDRGEDVDLSKLDVDYKNIDQPKIYALKELLSDLPQDEAVLVLTHSSKFADLVARKIGKSAERWPLSSQPELQESVKKGFGTDYRVLVAVISGVGTGTDGLQEKSHIEVWLSQDQDGVQNEQAKGRLYRSGQTKPVQRFYIRTAGTIDEDVYARQLERGERMSNLYGDTKEGSCP